MLIKERQKYKSTATFKCDKCGNIWEGNFYVISKKELHLCPSCSLKLGWENKFKNSPFKLTGDFRKYIKKRIDGKSLDEHFQKSKNNKIIVKCPECNDLRQSNGFDIFKYGLLCSSCTMKNKWDDDEYRNKILSERIKNGHYQKISESCKKSDIWWESRKNMGIKRTLKNTEKRGCSLEDINNPWYVYRRKVYLLSNRNYNRYKNIINPNNLPRGRGKYHLDHIFTVMDAFKNNIPIEIVSHPTNLQMLEEKKNISKDFKSEISINILYERIDNWK